MASKKLGRDRSRRWGTARVLAHPLGWLGKPVQTRARVYQLSAKAPNRAGTHCGGHARQGWAASRPSLQLLFDGRTTWLALVRLGLQLPGLYAAPLLPQLQRRCFGVLRAGCNSLLSHRFWRWLPVSGSATLAGSLAGAAKPGCRRTWLA